MQKGKISTKVIGIVSALLLVVSIVLPLVKVDAARDCDSNAVMKCGAADKQELISKINGGDGANSSANLKQVYYNEGRGITEAGIMSPNTVDGEIHKDGTVWVNGAQVASGVFSSGREFLQNSTKDGSLWMRPPAVSFNSNSLPAFVNMDGGTFHWAIIKSCGNPIKPLNKPFGQIYKRVINLDKDANTAYAADTKETALEVEPGNKLKYVVYMTNVGTGNLTGIKMTDPLPAEVKLANGDPTRVINFNYPDVAPNQIKDVTITVNVDANTPDGTYIDNEACFTANDNQKGCDKAIVKVKRKKPTPTPTPTTTPTPTPTVTPTPTPTITPTPTPTITPTPTPTPVVPSEVTPTPTTPVTAGGGEIPQTGVESAGAGVLGMSGLSYVGYTYLKGKKALKDALRNWKK